LTLSLRDYRYLQLAILSGGLFGRKRQPMVMTIGN